MNTVAIFVVISGKVIIPVLGIALELAGIFAGIFLKDGFLAFYGLSGCIFAWRLWLRLY